MRTWSNGIIVFAFGTTAWESLRNFSSRSRWFAPQFHPNGVGIEPMEEGTTILCDMGFGVFSLFFPAKMQYLQFPLIHFHFPEVRPC